MKYCILGSLMKDTLFFMSSNRTFSIKNVFLSSSIKKVWVFFVCLCSSKLFKEQLFFPLIRGFLTVKKLNHF